MAEPSFAPHPRTVSEWMVKGIVTPTGMDHSQAAAERKLATEVFGHDFKTDSKGVPIETGKGSAAQPTQQHREALDRNTRAERAYHASIGYHPGLEGAFDPRMQAAIDAAVKAALAKSKPRAKPGRKAKQAAAPAAPAAE